MKKLVIDKNICIGCGTCAALLPSVFKLDINGKAVVKEQNGASEEEINEAVSSCPVKAISWKRQ